LTEFLADSLPKSHLFFNQEKTMIIRDLEVLEVVSQDENVEGGWYYGYYSSASASAGSDALALGQFSYTSTNTSTQAVAGLGSSSSSGSYSSASTGYYW
jgi:hypothetical protein